MKTYCIKLDLNSYSVSNRGIVWPPAFQNLVKRLTSILQEHIAISPQLYSVRVQGEDSFDIQDPWIVNDLQAHHTLSFRGIKIRSFVGERGDELVHMRSCGSYKGEVDFQNEDQVIWKGSELPMGVLAAVYGAEEIDTDVKEWCRGMTMGLLGWSMLRTWEMGDY